MNLLEKTIYDQRLFNLIKKMFNAHILVPKKFYFFPALNILSPILSNIYFNELDKFINQLIKNYKKNKFPNHNKEYFKLLTLSKYEKTFNSIIQKNIRRYRRKKLLNKDVKAFLHANDIKIKYVRYLNNILIGIRGSKKIAEQIKKKFQN
jgi:hypothetical protein